MTVTVIALRNGSEKRAHTPLPGLWKTRSGAGKQHIEEDWKGRCDTNHAKESSARRSGVWRVTFLEDLRVHAIKRVASEKERRAKEGWS
jgi:hypothetical protein